MLIRTGILAPEGFILWLLRSVIWAQAELLLDLCQSFQETLPCNPEGGGVLAHLNPLFKEKTIWPCVKAPLPNLNKVWVLEVVALGVIGKAEEAKAVAAKYQTPVIVPPL